MKQWILNSYLARLYSEFRVLFVVVLLLVTGTAYHALKSSEEFPFLLYGMYSLPEKPKTDFIAYSIILEGKEVLYASLWDAQRELIQSPLSHLAPEIAVGTLSSATEDQFKAWLFRYASDMRMTEKNTMEVYQLSCTYNMDGMPSVTDRKLLFSYHAN